MRYRRRDEGDEAAQRITSVTGGIGPRSPLPLGRRRRHQVVVWPSLGTLPDEGDEHLLCDGVLDSVAHSCRWGGGGGW